MKQAIINKAEQVQKLQKEILELQGFRPPLEHEWRDIGLGLMNEAFPHKVFPVAAVHEFISTSAEEVAVTCGFISGLVGALMNNGACLWVTTKRRVFAPGLKAFGVKPDQVVFADASGNKEALWMMEEGLKCNTLASVVGEVSELSFTESRRLQLAVEDSRVTGFIHRHTQKPVAHIACVSRWRIKPVESNSADLGMPGVGMPAWNVELQKIRNGKPGAWIVSWSPNGFRVTRADIGRLSVPAAKTG